MAASDTVITSSETIEDGMLVQPSGEIDFSRSPSLRAELLEVLTNKSPKRLIIDLALVDYMDSSGVATLVEAMQQQRKKNQKLVLCNLQPKVKSIFEIARLDMVFLIVDGTEDAKKA